MAITIIGSPTGGYDNSSDGNINVSVLLPENAQQDDRLVVIGAALRDTLLPSGWVRAGSQAMGVGNWTTIVDYFDVGSETPPTNYVTTLDTSQTGTPRWAYGAFLLRGVASAATVLFDSATGGTAPSVNAASDGSVEMRGWHRINAPITPDDSFSVELNVYDEPAVTGRAYTYIAANTGVSSGSVGTASGSPQHSNAVGITLLMEPELAVQQLSTPTNFSFTAHNSLRQLNGSWDAVQDAGTYEYQVDAQGPDYGWVQLAAANEAGTTFELDNSDGVDWNTTYRARVRAHPPE